MQETFSLEDIFNIMIELESLGSKHYKIMEALTTDYALKELFLLLAKQEAAHKELYMTYKTKSIKFDLNSVDSEYTEYIDVLLRGTIRFLEQSGEVEEFDKGVEIALNLEKDTLLFLSELRRIIDATYYPDIDSIMEQERGHLKALYTYLEKKAAK